MANARKKDNKNLCKTLTNREKAGNLSCVKLVLRQLSSFSIT